MSFSTPKPTEKALTYEMVIAEIMRTAPGPLPTRELASQMLLALPSFARNPQQAMRQHIRQANGLQQVFLDADTVLPLRLAYQGVRFRVPLERESFDKGLLPLGNTLQSHLPQGYRVDCLKFMDASGNAISAQIEQVAQRVQSLLGSVDETHAFANLSAWYRAQKMYAKDHILVAILDWKQGILQLEREPFGQRNQALLAERNRLLAELFFELLESAAREDIYVHAAVPTVYARLPDKGGYPPNRWWDVLKADGRKGGFWKLIPRAAQAKTMSKRSKSRTARTREVAIGDVEPMDGGDGALV